MKIFLFFIILFAISLHGFATDVTCYTENVDMTKAQVSGWAHDPDFPSSQIFILLYVDGSFAAATSTNLLRLDVNSAKKISGTHGFAISIPPDYQDGKQHDFEIYTQDLNSGEKRLACQNYISGASSKKFSIASTTKLPIVWLDSFKGDNLSGWAFDPDTPSQSIVVQLFIDDRLVVSTKTSSLRSDVNKLRKISGNHGFNFKIPSLYFDGKPHALEVRGLDNQRSSLYSLSFLGGNFSFRKEFRIFNNVTPYVAENMVAELAPSATPTRIFMINKMSPTQKNETQGGWDLLEGDEIAVGCVLSYQKVPRLTALLTQIPSSKLVDKTELLTEYNKIGWKVATWHNEYSFCDSPNSQTVVNPNSLRRSVPTFDNTGFAQSLEFYPDRLHIKFHSDEHYRKYFGGLFYRDGVRKDWPELFIAKTFEPSKRIALGKVNRFIMELTAANRVRKDRYSSSSELASASIPVGASRTYERSKNATQFRLALSLQWRDETRCPKGSNTDADCKARFGKYVSYLLMFDDDREVLVDLQTGFDKPTGAYMYREDMKKIFEASLPGSSNYSSTFNPFQQTFPYGVKTGLATLNVDLLPFLKTAIIYGLSHGYLPSKLAPNGATESDEEYIKHFFISSPGLGFESPSLSRRTTDIYKFILRVE